MGLDRWARRARHLTTGPLGCLTGQDDYLVMLANQRDKGQSSAGNLIVVDAAHGATSIHESRPGHTWRRGPAAAIGSLCRGLIREPPLGR